MKSKAIEIKGCTDNNIMLEYMTGTPKFYRKIVDKINNCYILGIGTQAPFLPYNIWFGRKLIEFSVWNDKTDIKIAIKHGMGGSKYADEAESRMIKSNIPLCIVEDGFIRSIVAWNMNVHEVKYKIGLSAVIDYKGLYINALVPSGLENILNSDWKISCDELTRSKKNIINILQNKITKYNHQPIYNFHIGANNRKKVLVVDQVYGDRSIDLGLATDDTFKIMLSDAVKENPNADIIVKCHPDRRKGHYEDLKSHDNIYVLTEGINPICLLEKMDKVYVCTSQMGFEALMCGKEVHTYGMPFYAGWGLTIDKLKCERRTKKRSLEEVFHAAYIQYSRYISWKNQCETDIEHVIDEILELREEYFSKYGENSRMKNNSFSDNKSIGYYHCFPFNDIPKNSKVIIYGMGEVGRHYLKQIRLTNYCDVEFATDGNWQNIDYVDVKMVPPEEIAKSNSIIVLANGNAGAANEIKSKLLSLGITESRIIWNDMIISEAMVTETLVGNTNKKLGHYHIFPFANVKKGEQIIIWGMGEVGRHYVKQLNKTGYASINFAVDSNWKNINNAPVNTFSTDILKSKVNAKIVIANGNAVVADKIIQQLKAWGYSDDQIVWNDLIVSESLVVQGATSSKSTVPAKVSLPEPKKVISENSNTDKRGNVLIKAPVDKLNVVLEQVLKSQKDIEIVFS